MPVIARRIGGAVSDGAKQRFAALRFYPTLDTWRNPLTRGIARHFAHEAWLKTLNEIDFEYRITDLDIAGVACVQYETKTTRLREAKIIYVHGGGFVAGSPRVNAATILPVCELTGVEAIGVDYTLLPDAHYPVAVDQINDVYKSLLEDDAEQSIFLVSDSAGATLSLSNIVRWRDEGVKLPKAAIFLSPFLDGKGLSDTHKTLDGHDPLIKSNGGRMPRKLFEYYAPGEDLSDPRISPIYADFTGLPPFLIQVGSREVCLGDAARLAEFARRDGVDESLQVYDGLFHLFHMHWGMDEAKRAHGEIAAFINAQL